MPSSFPQFSSTKQLYLHLSDHPLIIDGGTKNVLLEKRSGKKCYILAPRNLTIAWGDRPECWTWTLMPDARFDEVARLKLVRWLDIHGNISTGLLSPDKNYAAYLVYKLIKSSYGFELINYGRGVLPAEVSVGLIGEESEARFAVLEPESLRRIFNEIEASGHVRDENFIHPTERKDGWLEVELGKFYNKGAEDLELNMSLKEVKAGNKKRGLIVQGIEIRPKQD